MHYRITVPLGERAAEEVCSRLAEFAVEGLEEFDDSVAAYFVSREDAEAAARELGGGEVTGIGEQNWCADWQAQWTPIAIGERFWLCPEGVAAEAPAGRIRLAMIAGNVFGGGDHATTQLCLRLLETVVQPGDRVADIGSGTGVLTRAARELGAWAIGCDIDPAAAEFVEVMGSAEALAAGCFGVVTANIHLGVLREIGGDLRRIVRPGGWLILSGFLPEQREAIAALFGHPETVLESGGWCAASVRMGC